MEIPKNLKGQDLIDYLETASDSKTEQKYFRPFDQSELDLARANYADTMLEVSKLETDWKVQKQEHDSLVKSKKKRGGEIIQSIRQRGVEESGMCYTFKDYENKTVTIVNKYGQVINQRPMTPEEKQMTITDSNIRVMHS